MTKYSYFLLKYQKVKKKFKVMKNTIKTNLKSIACKHEHFFNEKRESSLYMCSIPALYTMWI